MSSGLRYLRTLVEVDNHPEGDIAGGLEVDIARTRLEAAVLLQLLC